MSGLNDNQMTFLFELGELCKDFNIDRIYVTGDAITFRSNEATLSFDEYNKCDDGVGKYNKVISATNRDGELEVYVKGEINIDAR